MQYQWKKNRSVPDSEDPTEKTLKKNMLLSSHKRMRSYNPDSFWVILAFTAVLRLGYFSLRLELVCSTSVYIPWGNRLRYKAWNPLSAFQIKLGLLQNPAEKWSWWSLRNRHGKSRPLVVMVWTQCIHTCHRKGGIIGRLEGAGGSEGVQRLAEMSVTVIGWLSMVIFSSYE